MAKAKINGQEIFGNVHLGEGGDVANPNIADVYDPTQTYNTGDRRIYNDVLYVCNDDNVTGAWDSTKWDSATIDEIISALTADDIEYSSGVSVADKLDNVPTFDTLTTSDNNKLLGVSVSGSDISVGAVDVSSLVKSVLLTSSMTCNYQDSSTIGYRSTTSDKVDITGITGYPTGKKILGTVVEYAYCGSVGEYYKISQLNIVNNETWANSKVGGTVRFDVRVYYLDV